MASRYGYEYGMGRPTMGQPPTIADHMAQRQQYEYGQQRLYEANQAAAFQQRNDLARQQAMDEQELETQVRANRLGLNGLGPMLTDRYSDAYQPVDNAGNPLPTGVDITVSPNAETAPAPLPQVRNRPIGLNRMIKPEFVDDLESLSSQGSRTRSVEEMRAIEQAKADERIRIAEEQARLTQQRDAANNQSRAVLTAGKMQGSDLSADKGTVANDMMTSVSNVYRGQSPITQPDELQVSVEPAVDVDPAEVAKYKKLYPQLTEQQIINGLRNNKKTNG